MLPRKVTWKKAASPNLEWSTCGFIGTASSGSLPDGVFFEAEIHHDRVGVELLALSKPAGSIFDTDHWMYDQTRDRFYDIFN